MPLLINTFDINILKAFDNDALCLCKSTKQFYPTVHLYESYCSLCNGADKDLKHKTE